MSGSILDGRLIAFAQAVGDEFDALGSAHGVLPQGATADGVADDHTILQAWLDTGGHLTLPAGEYYSSDNLILRKHAVIEGAGYGFDARTVDGSATLGYENQPGSRIHFAAGKGFRCEPQTTVTDVATAVAAGLSGYTQEGAFHSVIRNIALIGAGTGATVTGFYSRTEVHLENVFVIKFTGKGFDISASSDFSDGNSEFGTADLSTLKSCWALNCGSHAFHIRGREANVIRLDSCNAYQCSGWAFLDESLLGNHYTNCHAATCSLGSFKSINSVCNSTYGGCYVEPGTGQAPDLSYRCTVNGGYLADFVRQFNVGTNGHPSIVGTGAFEGTQYNLRTATDESTTVANGHAMIYRGAGRGVVIMGAPDVGGNYDVMAANKNAAVAWGVPTGTQNFRYFGTVQDSAGNQILTTQRTGCPSGATDLASAITLVNFLRTALMAHGAIAS